MHSRLECQQRVPRQNGEKRRCPTQHYVMPVPLFIKERGERSFENGPLKPSERQRIQFLSHTYIHFVNKTDPKRRAHRWHYAKVYKKRKAKTVPGSKLRVIGMVAKDKDWTEKEAVYVAALPYSEAGPPWWKRNRNHRNLADRLGKG